MLPSTGKLTQKGYLILAVIIIAIIVIDPKHPLLILYVTLDAVYFGCFYQEKHWTIVW